MVRCAGFAARGEDAISAEEMSTQCALSGDAHSAERLRLYKFMVAGRLLLLDLCDVCV